MRNEEQDHSAGLIHQAIPDVEGTEPRLDSTIAEAFFAVDIAMRTAEAVLDDAVIQAAGCDPNDPDSWPFGNMVYDYYDRSFELQGVKSDWEPATGHVRALLALGFDKGWVTYTDGTQRAYSRTRLTADRLGGIYVSESEDSRRMYQLRKLIATGNPASPSEIGSFRSEAQKKSINLADGTP